MLPQKGAPKYVVVKEQPCLMLSARLKKKATNMGNDRIEIIGKHIWTGKKYEVKKKLVAPPAGINPNLDNDSDSVVGLENVRTCRTQ